MNIKLNFMGAVGNVTGSKYLLEINDKKLLVDCGLYQERNLKERDWQGFPFDPKKLDAVLITHAHLDHCGMLPRLVKDGCRCPVYSTPATQQLAEISLMDSAELQVEDAEYKRQRHKREKRKGPYPELPLYTPADIADCLPLCHPVKYGITISIDNNIGITFYNAGHILGSAMAMITVKDGAETRKILFTGDMGRKDSPILKDPATFTGLDYLVIESTYGDRVHESREKSIQEMADAVNMTVKEGGNIVIPTFVIERAQDVLYYLNQLLLENRIPHLAVFLDSPMAVKVTEVFRKNPDLFDEEMSRLVKNKESFFSFNNFHFVSSIEESKSINHIKGTIIIMAGSGMCTGGRIKHHLVANISRPESTILFSGYQAGGTLGRLIVEGAKTVRILGQERAVNARIVQVDGFSAHADRDDMIDWLSVLQKPPRHMFVTHGEPEAAQSFAALAKGKFGWDISVPAYLDAVNLD